MIFLTVGTQFGFDRLVEAVDIWAGKELQRPDIYAQIGTGKYKPKSFEYTECLDKSSFDKYIKQASAIISHAGMGTIAVALEYNKPLLVMPRLSKYGEVVNDHQLDIATKFEKYLLVAYTEDQLSEKIKLLKRFVPKPRIPNQQGVIERIQGFLNELSG